jgi:hypothetical protein
MCDWHFCFYFLDQMKNIYCHRIDQKTSNAFHQVITTRRINIQMTFWWSTSISLLPFANIIQTKKPISNNRTYPFGYFNIKARTHTRKTERKASPFDCNLVFKNISIDVWWIIRWIWRFNRWMFCTKMFK